MEAIIELLTENFGFDLRVGLFSILNFFLVFLILKKFLFDKIGKTLGERQKIIDKGLTNYEKAQEELDGAKKEASKIIDKSKEEANKIVEASYQEAQKVSDKLKKNTQSEVNMMIEKARQNIAQMEEGMRADLRSETVELIIQSLEKIFENNVPENINKDLIRKSISDLNK